MSFPLWLLLAAIIVISLLPPLASLAGRIGREQPAPTQRIEIAGLQFYLLLISGFCLAYSLWYFSSRIEVALSPSQSIGGRPNLPIGEAQQSFECIQADQVLQRLRDAARGTVAYRGGADLHISRELWAQMPPEARAGLASLVGRLNSCAAGGSADEAVSVRDIASGQLLGRGVPSSFLGEAF